MKFEHKTREQDDLLNLREEWGAFGEAWCKVTIDAGGESAPVNQVRATATWTLETHWCAELAGLTPAMRARLVEGGKVLPIKSVVNVDLANRELVVTCEETY